LSRREWEFLHGLARLTAASGHYLPSPQLLTECAGAITASGKAEPLAALCMTALCRLRVQELRAAQKDAIGYLADRLADCLRGEAPVRFFGLMLEQIDAA